MKGFSTTRVILGGGIAALAMAAAPLLMTQSAETAAKCQYAKSLGHCQIGGNLADRPWIALVAIGLGLVIGNIDRIVLRRSAAVFEASDRALAERESPEPIGRSEASDEIRAIIAEHGGDPMAVGDEQAAPRFAPDVDADAEIQAILARHGGDPNAVIAERTKPTFVQRGRQTVQWILVPTTRGGATFRCVCAVLAVGLVYALFGVNDPLDGTRRTCLNRNFEATSDDTWSISDREEGSVTEYSSVRKAKQAYDENGSAVRGGSFVYSSDSEAVVQCLAPISESRLSVDRWGE